MKRIKLILLLCCCILVAACGHDIWSLGSNNANEWPHPGEKNTFFPEGEISQQDKVLYARQLEALGENSLYREQLPEELFVYRLTVLPQNGNPFVIRIVINREEKTGNYIYKRADGIGMGEIGSILVTQNVPLGTAECEAVMDVIDLKKFWYLPGVKEGDGDRWILEGADANRYYITTRGNPTTSSSVVYIGLQWIDMGKSLDAYLSTYYDRID
ncbi:hypothetical protein LJC55_02180 [Eubacteriales bacterium OttesenSCG-928-N14]|nr:hypothetical protein [Eubacteriales bacterium OttesenSCG-928-N14]